ncbi:hypothetical protein IVB36_19635 [Bradyrhizobium sp. 35]|uniref:hypothetical protein n=1 Tax=unclassified Bradyrhizobium TaxID=2631580 RepID=UPI001FFC161A|nr:MULTISPECIES: hypothetical protein [unclassified Bradyrhizobium]MCK1453048.1 hypothetical protein [Bradyrhizobium sp. 35]MCK1553322.1 hypothetical protein [Bradyrhizobium sp. 177]
MSLLLGAVVALNPIGLDLHYSAFFAGEQLARNIAQPVVLIALAVMALATMLEWLVRSFLIKRRARGAS